MQLAVHPLLLLLMLLMLLMNSIVVVVVVDEVDNSLVRIAKVLCLMVRIAVCPVHTEFLNFCAVEPKRAFEKTDVIPKRVAIMKRIPNCLGLVWEFARINLGRRKS
jgi:hypothetical protein